MEEDILSFEKHLTRLDQYRIWYDVGGSGPAVVLLHGLSGSSRWWARNVPSLAASYRVYVVDLVGFGRSRGQNFLLPEMPELVLRWMDSLGIERAHLIGHSMGGLIAAQIAARQSTLVDRLVLVDAAAVPLGRTIVGSAMRLPQAARYMGFSFLPVLFTDALKAGARTLLRAALDIHRADITGELSRIASRTLIVWGEKDPLVPLERGRRLHKALPAAQFEVIRGAGHNPMWDRPKEFNRLVLEFLRGEK
jgi:pimeloyl-ACP methyl ester carboxylesterase